MKDLPSSEKGEKHTVQCTKQLSQHQPFNMPNDDTEYRNSSDPQLIPRVRQYLYENEDKVYIDVNAMADALQKKYRDYRNKPRNVFRAKVRKAYDEITENLVKRSEGLWQDDDEIDLESEPSIEALAPQLVQASYKRSASHSNGNFEDKELIDISSDEESPRAIDFPKHDEIPIVSMPPVKKSNFASEQQSTESQNQKIIRPYEKRARREVAEPNTDETKRSKNSEDTSIAKPIVTFSHVGGNAEILDSIIDVLVHIKHPEIYKKIGICPPRGILLHGPPGCGKTLLANAIAGEMNLPLLKVSSPELIAGVSGESEAKIRDLFGQAAALSPCILFLDEIDSIATHRITAQKEMEKRVVSQLLTSMDDLSSMKNGDKVLVLGATSRPDAMDPALRSAGRFDRELCLGIPNKETRESILRVHTDNVSLSSNVCLKKIASLAPGFVGSDLVALIRESALAAAHRALGNLEKKVLEEPSKEKSRKVEENKVPEKPKPSSHTIEAEEIVEETEANSTETNKKLNSCESENEKKEDSKNDESERASSPIEIIPQTEDLNDKNSKLITNAKPENSDTKRRDDELDDDEVPPPKIRKLMASEESKQRMTTKLDWLKNGAPMTDEQLADLCIEERDFLLALKNVQPSAIREGFITVPDVTWNDIGSLQNIRQELQMTILAPIRHAEQFEKFGLTAPTGILLCGPPGCGKTLLAKAIANEAGINFISVKGPELLNMYVGESEKAVRQCFIRAKNSAPCVIFFDELDALCPKRSESNNSACSRVVNQMLTEMDGVESRKNVFLMAATNRPDIIDPAILRPGRLDKVLYVGFPDFDDRVDIIRALTKGGTRPKLANDVDLQAICSSRQCEGYTGADLAALVREASTLALRELMENLSASEEVSARHFQTALKKIRPSVHEKDKQLYEKLKVIYSPTNYLPEVVPMETPEDPPSATAAMEAMET